MTDADADADRPPTWVGLIGIAGGVIAIAGGWKVADTITMTRDLWIGVGAIILGFAIIHIAERIEDRIAAREPGDADASPGVQGGDDGENAPESGEGGEDTPDIYETRLHAAGEVMFISGGLTLLIATVGDLFYSLPADLYIGAGFMFAILGMGLFAIAEVRVHGEIPDPREREYSVPDDPMTLLDSEDEREE